MSAAPPAELRRLDSPAALVAAIHRLRGDAADTTPDPAADRGLAIDMAGVPTLVLGLRRGAHPLGPGLGRAAALTVAPILLADSPAAPAAVQAALRELFIGEPDWHVLRLHGAPDAVIDAAWRFAARLGVACAIVQDPPPSRAPDGGTIAGPVVLSVYSPRLKGRWVRAADAGVPAVIGGAARERIGALAGRLRGRRAPDGADEDGGETGGSRFFALELAAVSAAPSWGPEVTFREIAADEAAAEPLRHCTGVRRLEEALRRGDRCFGTYVDGALAHHHWVSLDPDFLRRMLPARVLDRPVGHPFDSYTSPAFRGRRLQAITHHWLALRYREEGVERFAVRITATNAASIRGIQKAGYVELPGR